MLTKKGQPPRNGHLGLQFLIRSCRGLVLVPYISPPSVVRPSFVDCSLRRGAKRRKNEVKAKEERSESEGRAKEWRMDGGGANLWYPFDTRSLTILLPSSYHPLSMLREIEGDAVVMRGLFQIYSVYNSRRSYFSPPKTDSIYAADWLHHLPPECWSIKDE